MDTSKQRTTVLIISTGFLVLFLLFSWHWMLVISLAISLAGIFSNRLTDWITWGWMRLALLLGMLVPNIILGLVYYMVLFPLAIINKLFNKDPLMLSRKYNSYFIDVNRELDPKEFEKTW